MPKRKRYNGYSSISKRRKYGGIRRAKNKARFYGQIKQGLKLEKKSLETAITSAISQTATVAAVNLLAQGVTTTERIGRNIMVKSVHLRSIAFQQNTAVTTPQFWRMALVYDRQPNGALAAFTDIFTPGTSMADHVNLNNAKRFSILWHKCFCTTLGSGTARFIEKYIKVNLPTTYSGTTAAIGSIATGSLLYCTLGNVVSGTDDGDQDTRIRIRYTDA